MPKTRPARRRRPATYNIRWAARTASTAGPPAADTNTPGPSGFGAEPAWTDQHRTSCTDSSVQTAVSEAVKARQTDAAAPSSTAPGTPHPEDVGQAVLASISDAITGTDPCCTSTPPSTPISSQVPPQIKQKYRGVGWGGGGEGVGRGSIYALCCQRRGRSDALQIDKAEGTPALQLVWQKSVPLLLPAWIKTWNRFCAILSEHKATLTATLTTSWKTCYTLQTKKQAGATIMNSL